MHCMHARVQVIRTTPSMRKPPGILWHRLSPEKLGQIRVLQELKARIEKETGKQLPTGEVLPRWWAALTPANVLQSRESLRLTGLPILDF